jgi:hypothetical protein
MRRLAHVAAGQRDDLRLHRRREQHGLTLRRKLRDDLLDVGQEAQVEHLVGLVQHQGADGTQVQLALPGQVQQSSGSADDHVDTLVELLDLRLVGTSAVDREDPHIADLPGGQQVVGDLHTQLAGRYHHQRLRGIGQLLGLRPAGFHIGFHDDPLEQREAEAEGLAGAGLGLADDVLAGQCDRQRHLLNGEGRRNADGFQGLCGLG